MMGKSLKSITGGLAKRVGKFKAMSKETREDIVLLNKLKEENDEKVEKLQLETLKKLEKIEAENGEIDGQVKEAKGFADALDKMFGFNSDNEEVQ